MYNLQLSPEQIEIRDTVRDLVARGIKPFALQSARLEAGDRRLPMHPLEQASQMGLRALALSETSGGAGVDNLTCCIVTEELAAGDPDVAAVLSHTATLAHVLFDQLMSAEQRSRFLPLFLADDRCHLAFAVQVQTPGPHGPSTLLVPVKSTGLTTKEPDQARRWYHGACGDVTFENVH